MAGAVKVADALRGAQNALPQRVRTEVESPGTCRWPRTAAGLRTSGFLRGSPAFRCRSRPRGARPQDVGQQFHHAILVLRQQERVKDRILLAGDRRYGGRPSRRTRGSRRRPSGTRTFVDHVFEKMADPGHRLGFVAGTRLDEEPQAQWNRPRRCTRQRSPDRSARCVQETPQGTSKGRLPRVTIVNSAGGCSAR